MPDKLNLKTLYIMNALPPIHHVVRCADCQHTVAVPILEKAQIAQCPHCHNLLENKNSWSLKRCATIAWSILILMPFALSFPLLSIDLLGIKIDASVWGGVWKMATQGYPYTAFLILLCAVVMPITFPLLIILLRFAQILRIKPRNLLLTLTYLKPWVMLDVYLIALAVTMFKVREYATLHIDIYLIAFICTALLTTLLFIKISPSELWNSFYPTQQISKVNPNKLKVCQHCYHNFEQPSMDYKKRPICPRCHSKIDLEDSLILQRTWACLFASIIMLIPANLLPMSIIYLNGAATADTLMSGVISFIDMGSYLIAFIVFIASIFVPVGKIIVMLYLLLCVHFHWTHSIKWQMRLLHFIHFVGRWSMLDLFVLALMMSLVARGQIIDFSVGPAAFYFGLTVFLTIIATSQFQPRLIWKLYDKTNK